MGGRRWLEARRIGLVVVDDFDFVSICILPSKTDSILIVDSHAMLAAPIAFEGRKPVSRRNSEVFQQECGMQRDKLATNDPLKSAITPTAASFKYDPCFTVRKALDRAATISRSALYAIRSMLGRLSKALIRDARIRLLPTRLQQPNCPVGDAHQSPAKESPRPGASDIFRAPKDAFQNRPIIRARIANSQVATVTPT
jgi:hypothetical protein